MNFFRFSDFQVLFGLFCTTQDTIFFVLVVDSLAGIAALGTEIKVAMKVENEHLAEIPHLGVLCVRGKSGEVFGLDAVALDREGIHQHRTEAPFVGIVTDTDMVVELAVLQRLAPEVIAARGYFAEELPTFVHTHNTCADARIEMLVRVGIAKRDVIVGERCNREDQFVIEHAHLHTRSHLQTMKTSVVSVGAYRVRLTVNQLLVRLIHNRFVIV